MCNFLDRPLLDISFEYRSYILPVFLSVIGIFAQLVEIHEFSSKITDFPHKSKGAYIEQTANANFHVHCLLTVTFMTLQVKPGQSYLQLG